MRNSLTILFILCTFVLNAQTNNARLSGTVKDEYGKYIESATITVKGYPSIGALTNSKGFYSIQLPSNDSLLVYISFTGFKEVQKWFYLKPNSIKTFNPTLKIDALVIPKISITYNIEQEESITLLTPEKVTSLSGLSLSGVEGSIKTFVGVSSKSELSQQYSVRGGSFDENLVYINGVPAFKPQMASSDKQEGLSIINPYMVGNIEFSSGGFGVQYGDKMSSVLDVQYKDVTENQIRFDASLMDANLTFEGIVDSCKLTYLIGARYKNTALILNSLEENGEYLPEFYDIQGLLKYKISNKSSLSYWIYGANNTFNFKPHDRITTFGSELQTFQMYVAFEGNELYKNQNLGNSISYNFSPSNKTHIDISLLYYSSEENENFDVYSAYRLDDAANAGKNNLDSIKPIAAGSYLTHARNALETNSIELMHNGKHIFNAFTIGWGTQFSSNKYNAGFNEWVFKDSADYSVPYSENSLELSSSKTGDINHERNLAAAYLYVSKRFRWEGNHLHNAKVSLGNRSTIDDYTNTYLHNPRLRILYKPGDANKVGISFSTGVYYQPPQFKELISTDGVFNSGISPQKSIHYVLGYTNRFNIWDRPFKFSSEIYYKDMPQTIPYLIDNVNIIYFPKLDASGYVMGWDTKLNGEFVKDIESWIGISFLKAEEHLQGQNEWIRKPNDQRINFSIFFQDYLPNSEQLKMNMTFMFGSKLPTAEPDASYAEFDDFKISPYTRFDMGFLYVIIGKENEDLRNKKIKGLSIGVEAFNLLDVDNKISYFWIEDIENKHYAVPNYLTSRRFNLKASIKI